MKEIWKDIKGYEGSYKISNYGRVMCLDARHYGKIKRPQIDKDGYEKVWLSRNSKKKPFFIHRLVALHFIDNPEQKPVVNHKDGNKRNNRLDNLEWCTHSENDKHAFKIGLRRPHCGGTSKPVVQIMDDGTQRVFKSISEASRKTGISATSISYCVNGKQSRAGNYKWRFFDEGVTTIESGTEACQ